MAPEKKLDKHKRRKRKPKITKVKGNGYRLQAYIELSDKADIDRALAIQGEGSLSGFAARAAIDKAKSIIDAYEQNKRTKQAPSSHHSAAV